MTTASPLIFASPSHPLFSRRLARELNAALTPIERHLYSDGETYIRVDTPHTAVRGKHAVVVATGSAPVHDHTLELLLIADALARMGPRRITAIIPFLPYRRQEHIHAEGEGIGGELMMRLLKTAGVTDLITADLHHESFKMFFGARLHEVSALPIFVAHFKTLCDDAVVVSPDEGGIDRAERLARALKLPMFHIPKKRPGHDRVRRRTLAARVPYARAIIVDDEINTGGTIASCAHALRTRGVKDIRVAATHGILSGNAAVLLNAAPLKEIVVTDSIPPQKGSPLRRLTTLSIVPLFAKCYNTAVRDY